MKATRICLILLGALAVAVAAFGIVGLDHCVVEGEMVDTPEGPRPIEHLKEGECVLTLGPTGRLEPGLVVRRWQSTTTAWHELEFEDGRVLRVTATHPVYANGEWSAAGKVHVGDRVRSRDEERSIVAIHDRFGERRVFDLEIEPNANFFASGVLVHNKTTWPALYRRSASNALKHLAVAEADFRTNDRDKNRIQDFWVRDVAGLYYLKPAGHTETIKLIEVWIAKSDEAPERNQAIARTQDGGFAPTYGYVFRALTFYEDDAGKAQPYDLGDGRNPSRFGFAAFPIGLDSVGQPSFIIDERGIRYKKDLKSLKVDTFPHDPERQGWEKLD